MEHRQALSRMEDHGEKDSLAYRMQKFRHDSLSEWDGIGGIGATHTIGKVRGKYRGFRRNGGPRRRLASSPIWAPAAAKGGSGDGGSGSGGIGGDGSNSIIWGYNPTEYRSHLYRGFEITPTPDPFNANSVDFGDRTGPSGGLGYSLGNSIVGGDDHLGFASGYGNGDTWVGGVVMPDWVVANAIKLSEQIGHPWDGPVLRAGLGYGFMTGTYEGTQISQEFYRNV